METRDAGRRRGPRRHPRPLRATLAKSTSSPPLPPPRANPHPLVSSSPPSFPPGHPRSRGAIRRFTPAILPTNTVLRSYSSSWFLRFFRSFRRSSNCCPSSIAIFYHILISHVVRMCSVPRAPSSRIFRLTPLTRHNASGDFCARHG